MTIKTLYTEVTNTTGIEQVRFSESHNDSAPLVTINAIETSLGLGDDISVDLGYVGDYHTIFNGYVKDITHSTPPTVYSITAYGVLIRAVDYFMASSDPNDPFTRTNIKAEKLVKQLLEEAGLTSYGYETTNFTFAVNGDLEINLTSVYDYCKMIADTLAWHIYGDKNGKIWFVERWPHVVAGDTSSRTIEEDEIISLSYSINERDLRNRVVVYGRDGISAEAKASSPHLPADFYKSVVASATWIDTQSMAQQAANRNLELLNRLGEEANLVMIGDASINARDIVTVVDENTGLNEDFYVYAVDHSWASRGFQTTLTLRK